MRLANFDGFHWGRRGSYMLGSIPNQLDSDLIFYHIHFLFTIWFSYLIFDESLALHVSTSSSPTVSESKCAFHLPCKLRGLGAEGE